MIEILPSDKAWLGRNFSGLKPVSPRRLRGEFAFCASLVDRVNRVIAPILPDDGPPNESVRQSHGFVEDRFHISAFFPKKGMPKIYEIDGRLAASAGTRHLPPKEMHMLLDMSVCLAHPEEITAAMQANMGIEEFILKFLLPYFYYHGYWDKYGEPPWEGLSHNVAMASLEQIAEHPDKVETYAGYIGRVLDHDKGIPGFTTQATPDAKKGMDILLEWVNRQEDWNLLARLKAVNSPPDGG